MAGKIVYENEFIAPTYEDCEYEFLWVDDPDNEIGISIVDGNVPYKDIDFMNAPVIFKKGKSYKVKLIIEEVL